MRLLNAKANRNELKTAPKRPVATVPVNAAAPVHLVEAGTPSAKEDLNSPHTLEEAA